LPTPGAKPKKIFSFPCELLLLVRREASSSCSGSGTVDLFIQGIEVEVEPDDVDPRLSEQSERTPFDVLFDELDDLRGRARRGPRRPGGLVKRAAAG
jgi:hypothetical protein